MDFSRSKLNRPPVVLDFVPIYWEPFAKNGERLIALIAIKPNIASALLTPPRAYVLLSQNKLLTLLGSKRGKSAHGILLQSEKFLTQRLLAGIELHETAPPFLGFSIGQVMQCKGWTVEQALNAAVNSVSIFGTTIDLWADDSTPARHVATTKRFLSEIKKKLININPAHKDRFNKEVPTSSPSTQITIDYAHQSTLIQLTSVPNRKLLLNEAIKEAESKILELSAAVSELEKTTRWSSQLFINNESLKLEPMGSEKDSVYQFLEKCKYFSERQNIEMQIIKSSDEAIDLLLKDEKL